MRVCAGLRRPVVGCSRRMNEPREKNVGRLPNGHVVSRLPAARHLHPGIRQGATVPGTGPGCPDPADGLTLSGSHHDTCLVNVVSVSVSKMMRCGSVGISRPRRRHGRRRSPARFPTGCGRPPGRPSDSARRRPGVHRPGTSTAPRGNKLRSPVMRRPFRQPAGPGEARRPSRPAFVSSTSRQVSQQLSGLRRRAGRL